LFFGLYADNYMTLQDLQDIVSIPRRPTWIEVDCAALAANLCQVRQRIGRHCQLLAVVKANAYGHGAPFVARTLLNAGADRLAVATLSEAIDLRAAGVTGSILVLGYTPPWLATEAVRYRITTTIFDHEVAQALAAAASAAQIPAVAHLKVNTGMNRLGLRPEAVLSFLTQVAAERMLQIEGVFTHFATADLADKTFAYQQYERFATLLAQLTAAGLRPPLAHAANSAAILSLPHTYLDMVRCGIALYGLHPDADATRLPPEFRPILTWKAEVAHVIDLAPGESVSYGQEFVATQPTRVAVLPVGYADGFPRRPYHWGHVLIHGQRAAILGRVCMDQTVVDVTSIRSPNGLVRPGDVAVLIGRQGAAELSADEIAARLHTNNYDVVSRILERVPRVYVNANSLPQTDPSVKRPNLGLTFLME
jgi:alanine racemase